MSTLAQQKLIDNGYQCYTIAEHALLDDELWVHQDTIDAYINNEFNPKYIYIFKDVYLNEWSSTHSIRKYKKLPKKYIKLLEEYEVL